MVDHPLHRRIHFSRLCQEVGPPLRIEGWIVERHEHGSAGEFADYEAMSPDERKRAAADIAKRLAEAGAFDGTHPQLSDNPSELDDR
jgi:hypothetical protein